MTRGAQAEQERREEERKKRGEELKERIARNKEESKERLRRSRGTGGARPELEQEEAKTMKEAKHKKEA